MKPILEEASFKRVEEVITKEFMSSEESEFEDVEENGKVVKKLKCYRVRRLAWERTKLKAVKRKVDEAYLSTLSTHARGMVKERKEGVASSRAQPKGPTWAVRL